MNHEIITEINEGMRTAFIDYSVPSNPSYRPQFIYNDSSKGKKVLSEIDEELSQCDCFQISVAFITIAGIEPFLQTLLELDHKDIPGRILTTNYLNFTQPSALKKLHQLKNIEIRMFDTVAAGEGFHTKGYIFKKAEVYRIIIGSSNVTDGALTSNHEWNTRIVSTSNAEMTHAILDEFNKLWDSEYSLKYDQFIERYSLCYEVAKRQRTIAIQDQIPSLEKYRLKPNSMQVGFIQNLGDIVARGHSRALLISATGTGKTYASAFAMRELGYKRVLFLVHRNQIAQQALDSFKRVMSDRTRMTLIPSRDADYRAEYVFGTIQTICKEDNLHRFPKNYFDCIILDEAHHSTANSYQRIFDYFEPSLWLGMTATPDRRLNKSNNVTEDHNVYELFNHQIAYEIRLQQAMEENLLCPFHYFGITDLQMINDDVYTEEDVENFRYLTSDDRVKYVMQQANYYGHSGDRVKGLIFCNRVAEAKELSKKFNENGWRTAYLSGKDDDVSREATITRLVQDKNDENALDYIISVDIFSEGVDIPEINQVIMLRPTQSPIVFIQQLGRGLRKAKDKEFVVILDFIGNYKNNFMIPIALSGDRSYNKDNIRRYVVEGDRVIPGKSTVHFDEISRKKIFSAIDVANFSDIKLIKENYANLKDKLGRIPKLKDFDTYGEMDVLRIFDNNSLGSYYKFLVKYEKEYKVRLSPSEEKVIEFVSKKLASGKRIQELELLDRMMAYRDHLMQRLEQKLRRDYCISMSAENRKNVINVMTNEFPAGTGKNSYKECVFLEKEDAHDYMVAPAIEEMLDNPDFYQILKELVEFGISRYKANYSKRYENTDLVLYQKYTYEDACRMLNWENNEVPLNIGGYKYDKNTKTFPVFINYDKTDDVVDTQKYEDHFTSSSRLIAISKSGRSEKSEDVQNFLYAKDRGIAVHLFVRKNKDDKISKEFYYLGKMTATGARKEFTMPNTDKNAVEIEWQLDTPMRDDIYEYIVNG